jgi:hypothetical protein
VDDLGGAAVGVVHDSAIWLPALEGHDESVTRSAFTLMPIAPCTFLTNYEG